MVTAHNPSWSGVSSDEHYRGHLGPTTPVVFGQMHLSGSLPFSLPLSCSHTATSPSSSEFQERCSTWFGVTQAWVQQHELLHMEHSHRPREVSAGACVAPPWATTYNKATAPSFTPHLSALG